MRLRSQAAHPHAHARWAILKCLFQVITSFWLWVGVLSMHESFTHSVGGWNLSSQPHYHPLCEMRCPPLLTKLSHTPITNLIIRVFLYLNICYFSLYQCYNPNSGPSLSLMLLSPDSSLTLTDFIAITHHWLLSPLNTYVGVPASTCKLPLIKQRECHVIRSGVRCSVYAL